MFLNKSAWFSSSVPDTRQHYWTLEGGTVACWKTADYLFSEDATCQDTLRIYDSREYLWGKVIIFHSFFLSACEKRQSVKSVCICHYVLPPASVQDEFRRVMGRMIWECEDEQPGTPDFTTDESNEGEVSRANFEPSDTESSESEGSPCGNLQDYPGGNTLTGYVGMDELQRYSGDLCDFHAECYSCSKC